MVTSERTQLRDPWIWIPTLVLGVGTQVFALRTGRSPLTEVVRWARSGRGRYVFLAWEAVTGVHLHGWPPLLVRYVDFYPLLGALIRPPEASVTLSEVLDPSP